MIPTLMRWSTTWILSTGTCSTDCSEGTANTSMKGITWRICDYWGEICLAWFWWTTLHTLIASKLPTEYPFYHTMRVTLITSYVRSKTICFRCKATCARWIGRLSNVSNTIASRMWSNLWDNYIYDTLYTLVYINFKYKFYHFVPNITPFVCSNAR